MTFNNEQQEYFLKYLDNHIFSYWKNPDKSEDPQAYDCHLELIISPICNTACTYCYYNNFAEKFLYPRHLAQEEKIIHHCEQLLSWFKTQQYFPKHIELFSGEFLNLPYMERILEIIDEYSYLGTEVTIPTNGTFCRSETALKKAQDLLDKYNNPEANHNITVWYSLSVDGKYLDNITRPMKDGTQYDDAFYDRLFTFAAKNHLSFHPMIAANGIELWPQNYDWYIENICKYFNCSEAEAINKIYLLEVRNPDWTPQKCIDLELFIDYWINKTYSAYEKNPEKYFEQFLLKPNYSNFLDSLILTRSRGLGCSLQMDFIVRLGDLALVPCHRTAYPGFTAGRFQFSSDEPTKMKFKLENPDIYILAQNFDSKLGVKCNNCPINSICNGYCLGTNYEVNKDFFIPTENVCKMEYTKTIAIIKNLQKIKILDKLLYYFENRPYAKQKYAQILNLKNVLQENI